MKSGENLNTSLLNDIPPSLPPSFPPTFPPPSVSPSHLPSSLPLSLPSSFPSISGHKSFIGYLYLEYTYNNPVVNMFVKLMTDAVNAGGGDEEKAAINQEILSKY